MFEKIVEALREVFWLKKKPKKRARATVKKTAKKKAVSAKPEKIIKKAPAAKESKAATEKQKAVKVPKKPVVELDPALKPIGEITHYFDRIKVAVLRIDQGSILIGDKLTVVTGKIKFVQKIWSMQIESSDVKIAKKGQLIGIKIDKAVIVGDKVYK